MANKFQLKRTTTSGLLPNTTNSGNSSYIAAGELAINLTDKKMVSSNGSATFEIGANLVNLAVTGNAVMSNLEVTQTATINTTSIVVGSSPQTGISASLLELGGGITANNSSGVAGQALITGGSSANVYWDAIEQSQTFALSDETTNITTGIAKITFRAPFAMTLTRIPRASLSTASSFGKPTVDINVTGVSILSTKLTIDPDEKTSTTATDAAVLSTTSIADDAEITMDIDVAGAGAKGLKVTLYYKRAF